MARTPLGHAPVWETVFLLCASACAGAAPVGNRAGNAIVIADEDFGSGSGSVLTVLQNHVRGMSVAATESCPHIVMRSGSARSRATEVLVYVDGQRMSDTCILEGLNLDSIERVEVYPGGVSQRPGYRSNAGGLILVFTKSGPDAIGDA